MNSSGFVLIVEDCEDAVPALQIALESCFGCKIRHVLDVDSALATLDHSLEPLLGVITDLNLPGKNGVELIRYLRATLRWKNTPVVVVSADTHPRTPERVRASGADDFFGKPYSPLALCNSLEKIIHAKWQKPSGDSDPDHIDSDGAQSQGPGSTGD